MAKLGVEICGIRFANPVMPAAGPPTRDGAACQAAEPNLCCDFRLLGMDQTSGCHAEFVAVPESQVYEIPDRLTDAQAVLTEPLANIVHLFRIAVPPPVITIRTATPQARRSGAQ